MNKVEVYKELCSIFEKQWDRWKYDGSDSLAKVGTNRRGVYQGYPMTVTDYPCLGIMPESVNQELTGSYNAEDTSFIVQLYFYAFDFSLPKSAILILEMDSTINKIISENRNITGLVDRTVINSTSFGEFWRSGSSGGDVIAFGGMKTIEISGYAER